MKNTSKKYTGQCRKKDRKKKKSQTHQNHSCLQLQKLSIPSPSFFAVPLLKPEIVDCVFVITEPQLF